MVELTPARPMNGQAHDLAAESDRQRAAAGVDPQPIFSTSELEQLAFRRFNPYASLTAVSLSSALDAFEAGEIMSAARIWSRIAKSDGTIITAKEKREEPVELRDIIAQPIDETPAAADQAAALQSFWRNVRASHATKRHVVGKTSLLKKQMMESVPFEYAAHHIIWRPDAAVATTLPSGKKVPTLAATFEYVPLEFFEARTGELRFLGLNNFTNGEKLAPQNWLITTGPGLMFAASILHYFARLARHDMVNFSEKFGQPGTLVHTTASQDSPEGKAALRLAQMLAANYRGVLYGAAENKAEYLWPSGGTSGTQLPMHTLREDIKREITSMWLGSDLSTMSRGDDGEKPIGASVQGSSEDKKERSDCVRLAETLNESIDPLVLRWFFGHNAPILAKTVIEVPIHEDRQQLRESVTMMTNAGAQVPIEPIAKRLGVPIAKEGEKVFEKAVAPEMRDANAEDPRDRVPRRPAVNVRTRDADLETFLGPMRDDYVRALAGDLQPLRAAMEAVLSDDEIAFNSKLTWLRDQLPSLLKEINASPRSGDALAAIIRTSLERGYTTAATKRSTAELAATAR